jgi:hypothetical protein
MEDEQEQDELDEWEQRLYNVWGLTDKEEKILGCGCLFFAIAIAIAALLVLLWAPKVFTG